LASFLRNLALIVLLGVPAGLLLLAGPRQRGSAPQGRVVVRYWEKWSGVEGAAIKRIVDEFNATVGVEQKIWIDYSALGDVDRRMLVATAGGDPPDIAGLPDRFVAQFADRDALLPLDDLVKDAGIDLAAFKPIWLDICRYDGRLFGLPSTPYTIALFYNKRLFREAGLDAERPPQTTAELNEYAARLTRRDATSGKIVQLGFTTSPGMLGWWPWVWPCFFDGRYWDGRRFTLDTPQTRDAIAWTQARRVAMGSAGLAEPADAGRAISDVLSFEGTSDPIEGAQNPFLSERLAMVFQGPWFTNWARTYAPKLEYGVAAFPSVTLERQNVFASTDLFVIPRGSRHVREAMIFLTYLVRQDVLERLCKDHGKVSPFRTPRAEFFDGHLNPYVRTFDALAESPHAFGYPAMPTWSEAWQETLALHETVLRGKGDPLVQLQAVQSKMDRVVAEYERMAQLRRQR
jgi:multiple sugar transport system substrate-binding protein